MRSARHAKIVENLINLDLPFKEIKSNLVALGC